MNALSPICYQILYSDGSLLMEAPSETIRLLLGIHPALLEAETAHRREFKTYDARFGNIRITLMPIFIDQGPQAPGMDAPSETV